MNTTKGAKNKKNQQKIQKTNRTSQKKPTSGFFPF
jgi:hypothetical protein